MLLVGNVEARGIDVERVRVLHHELPHPQQAGLGPGLVAKLGLNLIPDLRKLLVAAQFLAGDLGHDLFVRHAQTQVGALAVFQPEHVVAHDRPAPARLPQFARMNAPADKNSCPILSISSRTMAMILLNERCPKEKIGINSGGQLADVSGADQKFVAGDFSVRRSLAQSRNKELRPTMHS